MDDLESLQAQICELQKQAETLLTQKKSAAILEVKAKIKTYGLTTRDLGFLDKPNSMAGVPVPIKYRHGDFTWTGRGRQPKFIVDYIANGGTLEDLAV